MLLKVFQKTRINIDLTEQKILKYADDFFENKKFYPVINSRKTFVPSI